MPWRPPNAPPISTSIAVRTARSIAVSEIPDEGLAIDAATLPDAPFSDPAWRLEGLSLRLEGDDLDVLVHGEIRATVPQVCGRCLERFGASVAAAVDVRVVPRPATADNVELAADELDVGVLIETETTLALPMKPLCRDDCLGLCPVCGGNRNVVVCRCQEAAT